MTSSVEKRLVDLDEVIKFIEEIKPHRYAANPGWIDIDLTPKQVAWLLKEKFGKVD